MRSKTLSCSSVFKWNYFCRSSVPRLFVLLFILLFSKGHPATAGGYGVTALTLSSPDACLLDPTNCEPVLKQPAGIARDTNGNLYVSDPVLHVIVAINPAGEMHLLAGNPGNAGFGNGAGTNALFNTPQGLAIGTDGRIYVADIGNRCVRVVTTAGEVTTLAGVPGVVGAEDGPAAMARFYTPASVAVDPGGNVVVLDTLAKTIRMVHPDGTVSTIAGTADPGLSFGAADFHPDYLRYGPMTVDRTGYIYALFYDATEVRIFAPDGTQTGLIDLSERMSKTSHAVSALAVDTVGNLYASGYVHSKQGGVGAIFRVSPLDELVFLGQDVQGAYGVLGQLSIAGSGEIFAASSYDHGVVKFTPPATPVVVRVIGADYKVSGSPLKLDAVAIGAALLSFQWSHNGAPVPGATNEAWELPSVQTNMSGSYMVTVADPSGKSASFTRTIQIYDSPPLIDVQPVSRVLNPATNFTFHVSARGSLPISYQWFRSGTMLLGETNTDLVFSGLTNADSAIYSVLVTNAFGSVLSEPAKIYASGISPSPVVSLETVVPGYPVQIPAGFFGQIANPGSDEWTFNGLVLGTNFDGIVQSFSSEDAGEYIFSVTNNAGTRIESVPVEVRKGHPYSFETIIGKPSSGSADGPPGTGLLNQPLGIVYGPFGLFVADTGNHTIRKVHPDGRLETIAGFPGMPGSADGFGRMARFYSPRGLAADATGNLYVADEGNRSVRRVAVNGEVTTVAQWPSAGTIGNSVADGPIVLSVAVDGSLLVGDAANVIRRVSSDGTLSILAGALGERGVADGNGTSARFDLIRGIANGPDGSVYIADGHLRQLMADGTVKTLAGLAATNVVGVWSDPTGIVYISTGTTIARVLSDGDLLTLAGVSASPLPGGPPSFPGVLAYLQRDGTGADVRIFATALTGATDGALFAVDGALVRKVTPDGVVTTICGAKPDDWRGLGSKGGRSLAADGTGGFYSANPNEKTISYIARDGAERIWLGRPLVAAAVDGDGAVARFASPTQLTRDKHGVLYILDSPGPGLATIRRISPEGVVTTLAVVGATNLVAADTFLPSSPLGWIAAGADGTIYVTDLVNQSFDQLDSAGNLTPVLTNIVCGPIAAMPDGRIAVFDNLSRHVLGVSPDGSYSDLADLSNLLGSETNSIVGSATHKAVGGMALGSDGDIVFSDVLGAVIRRIAPSGAISLVSGVFDTPGTEDGPLGKARLFHPESLAVDSSGNILVADSDGTIIRSIDSNGDVLTLSDPGASLDGPHESAELVDPVKLVRDRSGNLFVADRMLNTIRKIDTNGVVTTFAGFAWVAGSFDGVGTHARFSSPGTMAIDAADNIYIGDWGNNAIRKITPEGVVTTVAGPVPGFNPTDVTSLNSPIPRANGLAVDRAGNLYFAGQYSGVIRKITPDGLIELFAGNDGAVPYLNITGAGEGAPEGAIDFGSGSTMGPLAIDTRGDIYASVSHYSSLIYQFSSGGTPRVIASYDGIAGVPGRFSAPLMFDVRGIAVTTSGEVFVGGNNMVQKIDTNGWIYQVAGGIGGQSGSGDGTGIDALFSGVGDVTLDDSGALYVVDAGNRAIRKGKIAPDSAPALTISLAGEHIVLDWLADPAGYVLEGSDSLASGDVWTRVSGTIVPMENRNFYTLPTADAVRYFRLAPSQ